MNTHLVNLATHNGSGGNSVALTINPEVPERFHILPTDSHERRKQKREYYRKWCKRRGIEFVPLPGMPIAHQGKNISKDDPIPQSFYVLPTDDAKQMRSKYNCYKDWCKRRGIEYHPLPGMPKGTPLAGMQRTLRMPQCKPLTEAELQKPRWHDTCTTYQAVEERLAELVQMRDNCHEHNQWQALQSEINALRCKMLSWSNEKGDKHFSIAMIEPQPFC